MRPRIEYKYEIPITLFPHLLSDLRLFTEADKHSEKVKGTYPVSSVYFENGDMKSYFDKINGFPKRVKLRVRLYPLDPRKIHIEFKYKHVDYCLKKRAVIDLNSWMEILASNDSENELIQKEPVLSDFLQYKRANQFWPFIRIDYNRRALFAKRDKDIRITFDSNIQCCRFSANPPSEPYIPVLRPGSVILEIKTPGYFPFWLTAIIKKYSLSRSSISKYVLAVQNLALNSTLHVK